MEDRERRRSGRRGGSDVFHHLAAVVVVELPEDTNSLVPELELQLRRTRGGEGQTFVKSFSSCSPSARSMAFA